MNGGSTNARHLRRAGTADGGWRLRIGPDDAGWDYSGLRVLELEAGESRAFATGDSEYVVLPLRGSARVRVDDEELTLQGRRSVFSRVSDFAYLPRDAEVTITSQTEGIFALPSARCERRLPARYVPAEKVAVELRGAGSCSRQVNNFCSADAFEADRLIAVEVLTPAGNTSSYPPHKHDQERPGEESALEEIYYFEVAGGPQGPGIGYQRVYGGGKHPVDVLAEVRSGDAVLIPRGWHGPSIALPGYDLYYLNVMAGPGARVWNICDDPHHVWVRSTWADQRVDARLPMTDTGESGSR